jgi:hypothetical protein
MSYLAESAQYHSLAPYYTYLKKTALRWADPPSKESYDCV